MYSWKPANFSLNFESFLDIFFSFQKWPLHTTVQLGIENTKLNKRQDRKICEFTTCKKREGFILTRNIILIFENESNRMVMSAMKSSWKRSKKIVWENLLPNFRKDLRLLSPNNTIRSMSTVISKKSRKKLSKKCDMFLKCTLMFCISHL